MGIIGNQETSSIISVRSYFTSMIIGILPIIGDILLYKWGKSKNVRENKQNMCKAFLILKLSIVYPSMIIIAMLLWLMCKAYGGV